jgi:hypothetical protein
MAGRRTREADRCARGHLVRGYNAKKRPSMPKYVACRQCENDAAKHVRKMHKLLKEKKT